MGFLKEMLSSGITGNVSSKRGTLVWFVLLFTGVVIVNFLGFRLDKELLTMLFDLVVISMGVVFGEPFINVFALLKGKTPPVASTQLVNDFYLALKDGTTDQYVTGVTKNPVAITYGSYDDAMWSLTQSKVQLLITQNSIPASVETKTGGTQPPSRPPF